MPLWRAGDCRRSIGSVGALSRSAALLLCLGLGACSAGAPALQSANLFYAAQAPGMRPAPSVEMEADGIEGQRPPRRRRNAAPDDPSEPFSPNYGSVRPNEVAPVQSPA